MANIAEPGVTPRLRFPEFCQRGGWGAIQLADVAATISERVGTQTCVPYTVTSGVGLVSQQEKLGRTIAGNSFKNYVVLRKHDFAYNKSATKAFPQGFIARYVGDECAAVPNSIFTCFRIDTRRIDPTYLDYLFSTNLHGKWLRHYIAIGARAHGSLNVNDDDLFALSIPVPGKARSLREQRKIADCLTSLDEVIGAQRRKVEVLKAHKKGLMRQLFPREGETVPRLRFPQFSNGSAWEEAPLGEIAEIKLGKMLDSAKHTTGRLLPYLNNVSLRWSAVDLSNLPQMYFDDDELDRFGLKAGDVVVCEGGEPGRAAVWDGRLPDLKFQKAIHRVRFNIPFVAPLLVHYLEAIAGTRRFEMLFTGGGIKHLTRETFAQLKIPLAPLEEQQRIVDCLTSVSAQIADESRKREALEIHKKGLMQQLFPSPQSG